MDKPLCQTCPYWDTEDPHYEQVKDDDGHLFFRTLEEELDDGLVYGECRRYPKTEITAPDETTGHWPRTCQIDWCGEHPQFPAYITSLSPAPPPSGEETAAATDTSATAATDQAASETERFDS